MNRPLIVAGNWKMNLNLHDGIELAEDISAVDIPNGVTVILAPPFPHLAAVRRAIRSNKRMFLSAQNCGQATKGAFTGEVSAEMILSTGCQYVILGHSERRKYFYEDGAVLKEKVDRAMEARLMVIFCVGETLEQREQGLEQEIVSGQLESSLFHLPSESLREVIIAYEPVWAIGTGKTASPEQAQEMHAFIRSLLHKKYGGQAEQICILYGGSVNPSNAAELFDSPDIDGGLIGGASLKADTFKDLIRIAGELPQ